MSQWESALVTLRFRLGEFVLFKARIPMRVLPFEVISSTEQPETLREPDTPLQRGERGYLMRCLPLPGPQPVLATSGDWLRYIPEQFNRFYVDLGQTFAQYSGKFSSKTRSTIRRKIKKFEKEARDGMHWQRYGTPEEMRTFYGHARAVSSRSYQENLLDAGLPEGDDFVDEMLTLAAADRARGYIIFDGERPVTYMYCPITDGVLQYQFLGYDFDYVKWSVGTILHWLAFEDIFAEGRYRYFDFTEGQSEHKRMYSTGGLLCGNVYVFPRTLRNRVLVQAHRGINGLSDALVRQLDRMGLKAKIKQFLRRWSSR